MNELTFKSIEIRNFLSVGNKPLSINFDRGLNFVCGWNHQTGSSNGVGKTVVFYSAILYSLFGETGREIKQANIINYRNKTRMYCKLIVEKNGEEITIYRGRKPNIFYYTHNDTTYQNNNVYETQSQLNKLLDISEDVFTNIFIINASDTLDFIKEEGSVKLRDRFEKIFFKEIVFKKVLETVRKEHNIIQKQQEINNSKIQEKLTFLKRLKSIIESSKKVDNFEKQLDKYKKEQTTLQEKLMLIDNQILQSQNTEKLIKLQEKEKEYNNKRDTITSKIYYYTEKVKETKDKMDTILAASSICPLCRQPINSHTTNKLKDEYELEIQTAEEAKKNFKNDKIFCDKKLAKIECLESQIRDVVVKYTDEKVTVKGAINEINQKMKFLILLFANFQFSRSNFCKRNIYTKSSIRERFERNLFPIPFDTILIVRIHTSNN